MNRKEYDLVNIKQLKIRVTRIAQKHMAHRSEAELKLVVDYFLQFNVFKHIYLYNDLYKLAQQVEYRFCPANQILFRQDEEPEGFFVLIKGELAGGYLKSDTLTNFYFDDMDVLIKIRSGTGFGELAILENKKRAITMRAIRDSYLLFFSKPIYINLACPSLFKSINANIEFLKPLQTFKNFTDEKLREFCVASFEKQFTIGYIFSEQNAMPDKVALIKSGLIEGYRILYLHDLSSEIIEKHQQAIRNVKFPIRVKVATLGLVIRQFPVHQSLRSSGAESKCVLI